jgi:hypothetical protein
VCSHTLNPSATMILGQASSPGTSTRLQATSSNMYVSGWMIEGLVMSTTVHRSVSDGCTWSLLQAVACVHPDILPANVSLGGRPVMRKVAVMRWLAQLARAISHPSGLRQDAARFRRLLGNWTRGSHNRARPVHGAAGIMVGLRNLLLLLLSSAVLAAAPRAHFKVSAA